MPRRVIPSYDVIAAAGLVMSLVLLAPAFQNWSIEFNKAQADKALDEALRESSNTALRRVRGHCVIAHLAETNQLASSIRTGEEYRIANADGVPIGANLPVCAEDGSTAITVRDEYGKAVFTEFAYARREDLAEYRKFFVQNLRPEG